MDSRHYTPRALSAPRPSFKFSLALYVGGVASFVFALLACNARSTETHRALSRGDSVESGSTTQSSAAPHKEVPMAERAPFELTHRLRSSLGQGSLSSEAAPARDGRLDRVVPPEHPGQRLAFSRQRLAWLDGELLRVLTLGNFSLATSFRVAGARNVIGLVGGGFLIVGQDHVLRLSGADRRPEAFPRVPRIGPTTVIGSNQDSEQFWLYYEGILKLPRFDLSEPTLVASQPILDWTELVAFDRRALLAFGDGSFIYTVPDGLRRIDSEGRREHLPKPELAGRIWALGRAARRDQVWAATEQHLYLLKARSLAETVERSELAPHPVALATLGGAVAVLSVAGEDETRVLLRVDFYGRGATGFNVLRFSAVAPAPPDGGPRAALEPEIAWCSSGEWLAVNAFGLTVYDARRGVRMFPPASDAQKLAPTAP